MAPSRSRRMCKARRSLVWGGFCYLLLQTGAAVALERWLPEARDPEFAAKMNRLQQLLEDRPGNPLVLMLGSSRTAMGFQAGAVHVRLEGREASTFNFGISGGGPLLELLCLRRLLAQGIRPDVLIVEVLPAFFNLACRRTLEETWLQEGRLSLAELKYLEPHHSDPTRLWRHWFKFRLTPWSALRRSLLSGLALEQGVLPGSVAMDAYGWEACFLDGITDDEHRRHLNITRAQYRDSMQAYQPLDAPLQAVRALLELCRRHEITVALVVMPEGTEFRAMYPPGLRLGVDQRIECLRQECDVSLLDARGWLADSDLWDAHHPLPRGAAIFTERLTQDAIRPLLQSVPRQTYPESVRVAVKRR